MRTAGNIALNGAHGASCVYTIRSLPSVEMTCGREILNGFDAGAELLH